MSKNEEFKDRIDDLFSEGDPPQSEPVEGQQPSNAEPTSKERLLSASPSVEPLPQIDAQTKGTGHVGWEEYLNAIDRKERLGFSFDQEAILPLLLNNEKISADEDVIEAPLKIGDAILGSLQLEGDVKWSEAEEHLLETIAQQVTQHVENLRLLEQAEQYRNEAEQASRKLTHEGWDAYLQSPTAPAYAFTYDQNQVIAMVPDDADNFTDFASALSVQTQNLRVRDEDIGQIAIADPNYDQDTVSNLMTVVAARLSNHIENLRLLDETELSRQQLDKRAAELETVAQVSTAAATILEPQPLLQSVVDLTRYSFGLYYSSVYLLNETGDFLNLTAASGKIGHEILEEGHIIRIYQDRSIIANAARTREVVIMSDSGHDPDFMHHPLLPDTKSEMSIPLIVGEQLIGVFDVQSETINRFTDEDIRTFMTLASQTAVALRNAQLYAEQMETVERLRELDHLKSSFLANMSHELRTPLNSILGFTQVILEGLDGPLTEDMTMDLGLIEKNGKHLLTLINEVLDMSKIESGQATLNKEPLNLPEMLDDVVRTSDTLVREGVVLVNACQLSDRMFINADAIRLRQMLLNIVGNAIKFTFEGSVTVETEQINEKIQIRVVDTGIGIPPEKLENIFEAFSQVDSSTTRKVGGTGLGLPISRRLAEMHGGRLWAESQGIEGEGSVFCLELPIGDPKSFS